MKSQNKDIILTINVVEKELVQAVHKLSKSLKRKLYGIVLVNKNYAQQPGRPQDDSGLFEEVICDFDNVDELQSILKPYTERLLAATCRYEEAIQDFGKVIPFLPYLHTPSPTSLLWATEKSLMRDRLKNYDENLVPHYQYVEEKDLSHLSALSKGFHYPVIVKPTGLAKALLVARCETPQALRKRLEYTFRVIKHAYDREQYPGKPGVLVEEMMQGEMYSVDAYVGHDGVISCLPPVKVITAHAMGLPGFYGYQRSTTIDLKKSEIKAAFAASEASIKALNLSATTAHVELFYTPEGWKIIEVGARIGGYRDTLYREAYGIEHFQNDLRVRIGKKPKMPTQQVGHAVALSIYADDEGYVSDIVGVDAARNVSSVISLSVNAEVGDIALFSHNGGDSIVSIVLSNKDQRKLKKDIQTVRNLIRIAVKKLKKQRKEVNNFTLLV